MSSLLLVKRLAELGISIDEKKLRRWSNLGLIPSYKTRYQRQRKKRGRPSTQAKAGTKSNVIQHARLGRVTEWPGEALVEAAAVWVAQAHCKTMAANGARKRKILSKKEILEIKGIARNFFKSVEVIHELPSDVVITTPDPVHIYHFDDLETKVVRDAQLNELAVTWIAAIAKVRNNEEAYDAAQRAIARENIRSSAQELTEHTVKESGVKTAPDVFFKISDPLRVIVHSHSELVRTKNPLLKDIPADEFERALENKGVFEEVLVEEWGRIFLSIPQVLRNVPEWFQKQECRIPSDSLTMKGFWDHWDHHKDSLAPHEVLDAVSEITKDWRYLPTGWRLAIDRVVLEPSHSDHDELAVFIDGNDSRKKALYAPFNKYNPFDTYDPEPLGRLL